MLLEDARVALIERQAKDSEGAAQVAGNFLQARSMSVSRQEKNNTPTTECPQCGKHGHCQEAWTQARIRSSESRADTAQDNSLLATINRLLRILTLKAETSQR